MEGKCFSNVIEPIGRFPEEMLGLFNQGKATKLSLETHIIISVGLNWILIPRET